MTRKESRNEAFILIFEKGINNNSVEEILENAKECRDLNVDKFCKDVFSTTFNNLEEIDSKISKYLSGWTIERISKTALSILRLAVCEILYFDDIPESVSINEAVELSKIYASENDSPYINGVLGSIVRE